MNGMRNGSVRSFFPPSAVPSHAERNDSGTEVTGLYARLTYVIASLRSFPILATPCHRPASRSGACGWRGW